MHTLLILNEAPYGTERTYNGLRLGLALAKTPDAQVTLFLMADSVGAAKVGQKTPDGYYNIERMVKRLALAPHRVLSCGSCMDAPCPRRVGPRGRRAAQHHGRARARDARGRQDARVLSTGR